MVEEKGGIKGEIADFQWKIILVGNKRVGKTSICARYCRNVFNDDQKSS